MKDSDEVMDYMFCESCFEDGNENVPAVGFCVDCVTFFCKTCLKFHTKFQHDHVQQNHNEMPKDFCQEKCKIHKNEIVKHYCKKCDCFACSTCKINEHKECPSVQYIPTLLSEFEEKREHKNFEDMLKAVEEKLQSTKFAIDQGYGCVEQIKEETRSVIQKYKDNTVKLFDDLEREVVAEIDKIGSKDKKNLDENSKKLSELESSFHVIKSENESQKSTLQRCKILIMVKSCSNKVKSIKNSLEDLNLETGIHEVSYEPANVIKTTCDFGKLNITKPRKNINFGHRAQERYQTKSGTCLWAMGLVTVIAAIIYGNIYYSGFNYFKLENVFNAEKSNESHISVIRGEPIIILKEKANESHNSVIRGEPKIILEEKSNERHTSVIRGEPITILEEKSNQSHTSVIRGEPKIILEEKSNESHTSVIRGEPIIILEEKSNESHTSVIRGEPKIILEEKSNESHTSVNRGEPIIILEEKSNESHTSVIREEPIIISKADIKTNIESTHFLFRLFHLYKNYLIAADLNNNLLLLISTVEKKIVSEFLLQDELCDITKVAENQVAVTFFYSPEIQILQINNMNNSGAISWSVVKKMKNHLCKTYFCRVRYRDEKLFTFSENEITVFDINGNKLETIFLNIPDSSYIHDYLTITKYAENLHIFSLGFKNVLKIIHVTSGEQYETSYSHKDLRYPGGMTADDRGNVYVCGHNSHNIHRLSGDLTQGEVLLNETDGIESPWELAYSNEDNKLFILHSFNMISVFKIV